MSEYKQTNLTEVVADKLTVAGVDVTAAMAEVATINGLTASAAELNMVDGLATAPVITGAAGAANVANITITTGVARPQFLLVWLSDSAAGEGLTATAASGTVQAKTNSGTVINALTAKKALLVQTKADGTFVLEITDTAKTQNKVCVSTPMGELPTVYSVLTANFG